MRCNRLDASDPRRKAYMPFGAGKFECPANNWLGLMMVGILVGALMGEVGAKWELELGVTNATNSKEEKVNEATVLGYQPLDTARDRLTTLRLRKMQD
jgi:hypothetical protein